MADKQITFKTLAEQEAANRTRALRDPEFKKRLAEQEMYNPYTPHDFVENVKYKSQVVRDQTTGALELSEVERNPQEVAAEMKLFNTNPKAYLSLLEMKEQSEDFDLQYQRHGQDQAGNIELNKYEISQKGDKLVMDVLMHMHPTPLQFEISDGALVLKDENLNEDQVRNLKFWLHQRGINNFQLPQGLPPQTEQSFRKVAAEQRIFDEKGVDWNWQYQKTFGSDGYGHGSASLPESDRDGYNPRNPEYPAQGPGLPNTSMDFPTPFGFANDEDLENTISNLDDMFYANKPKGQSVARSCDNFVNDFMKPNRQRLGTHYTFSYDMFTGAAEFTWYKPKIRNEKGKKNKPYMTFSFEMRNGLLTLGYSVKDGEKLPNEWAEKIIENLKEQGNDYIDISQVASDADKGAFREACAKKGVIPVGINLKFSHLNKMKAAAKDALSQEEFLAWKEKLAKQLEVNALEKGTTLDYQKDLKNFRDELIDEVRMVRFKDEAYDMFMKPKLRALSEMTEPPATEVIGSFQAAGNIIMWFNTSASIDSILRKEMDDRTVWNKLSKVDHDSFKEMHKILTKYSGKNVDDISVTAASGEKSDLEKIYDIMTKRYSDVAAATIYKLNQEAISHNGSQPKNIDTDAPVRKMTGKAQTAYRNAVNNAKSNGAELLMYDVPQGEFNYLPNQPPVTGMKPFDIKELNQKWIKNFNPEELADKPQSRGNQRNFRAQSERD